MAHRLTRAGEIPHRTSQEPEMVHPSHMAIIHATDEKPGSTRSKGLPEASALVKAEPGHSPQPWTPRPKPFPTSSNYQWRDCNPERKHDLPKVSSSRTHPTYLPPREASFQTTPKDGKGEVSCDLQLIKFRWTLVSDSPSAQPMCHFSFLISFLLSIDHTPPLAHLMCCPHTAIRDIAWLTPSAAFY